jgi:hypothetical protein
MFGEHNAWVFGELLGMGAAEIAQLETDGVIAATPDLALHG